MSFIYSGNDLFSSTLLLPDSHSKESAFTIRTTSNALGSRKTTTITPKDGGNRIAGEINWTTRTFTVGGTSRSWVECLKIHKDASGKSQEFHWSWQRYTVMFYGGEWAATTKTGPGGVERKAALTLRRFKLLGHSEPAAFTFTQDVSPEDITFLMLVMLYCESKRADKVRDQDDFGLMFLAREPIAPFNRVYAE